MKKLLILPCLLFCLSAAAQADANKLLVSVDGGFSYRTAKAAPGPNTGLINRMRDGYQLGADVHYEFWPTHSLGLRASTHHYGHAEWHLSYKVDTYYIAPSYMGRVATRNGKGAWVFGVSLGYVSYHESDTDFNRSVSLSKGGFGSTLDLGYDVLLPSGPALGVKLSLFDGIVPSVATDERGVRQNESLAALDLGLVVRF
jgi:hypothetical protein